MKYPKRSQYTYAKSPYRVRNWPEYEAGLRRRGDLTIWLSEDAIKTWRAPSSGEPGGQRVYANIAIETALTIRMVFHLPLRQTEGFLRSLADHLQVDLPVPDHTTLSRRTRRLGAIPFYTGAGDRPVHVLIDSTGLRIHVGHLRKPPKHRAWRKLHVAVDARTGEIVASALTSRRVRDGAQAPTLLGQIDQRVASVSADSAYDTERVYEAAHAQGDGRAVRVCIPPGRNAQLSPRPSAALKERNRNVRAINKLGRREWPKRSGYSRRAMVEKHDLSIQDDHRPSHDESHVGGATGGGATRLPGPQHHDSSRHARQLPSGVTPSRGRGTFPVAPSHAPRPSQDRISQRIAGQISNSPPTASDQTGLRRIRPFRRRHRCRRTQTPSSRSWRVSVSFPETRHHEYLRVVRLSRLHLAEHSCARLQR